MIEFLRELGVAGWSMLAILAGSPVAAAVINKRMKPSTTPLEMIQELQEEQARRDTKDAEKETRLVALEASQRILLDYVHDLRQHIADGKPPPPPKWPDGMQV